MSRHQSLPFSRRRWLAGAAVAVASPWVIPASARGAEGVAPSERIAVALIGYGRQTAAYNLKLFAQEPDAQVVAIAEVDAWRLDQGKQAVEAFYTKQAAGGYKGCIVTRDFRELLARPDIDAVMIATPDHWHAPMTLAAFEAGKDVACEKPVNRCIAEGRQVADAASKLGRIYRVDSEFRSLKNFHRAAELVRNGAVGKLLRIVSGVPAGDNVDCPPTPDMPVPEELDYERWQGPAPRAPYTELRVHPPHGFGRPGWMRVLHYTDGIITNWGAHLNDIALWGANKERTGPVEIEGSGVWPPAGQLWNVLKTFEVRYRFADGLEMTYKTDQPFVRFEGEAGAVQANFGKPPLVTEPQSLADMTLPADAVRFPLHTEKRDFLDAVKSRRPPMSDAEVGHRVTSLCHLGHIAIHTQSKLAWDPEKERFTNNDAANAYIAKPIGGLPQ
jgi:predicted dehydrogenase